jgi:lipopolysaccharide transport system ATP-binding protein
VASSTSNASSGVSLTSFETRYFLEKIAVSTPVVKVEGIGKEYVIGGRDRASESLRETFSSSLAAPFRRFRQLSGRVKAEERFWALKDVNFEVHEGEVIGIIGRNGAGKSTLLKILSRITAPTEGRVEIRGRVASLLEVGTGFHPELTGRENIYLNGAILGMSRVEIDRKFDDIVDFSGIENFLDTPVKRYSSGMYVRLAFGVAAHLEAEILAIDEVLAVGDADFQRKCLGKMDSVARSGRTILFVSHSIVSSCSTAAATLAYTTTFVRASLIICVESGADPVPRFGRVDAVNL